MKIVLRLLAAAACAALGAGLLTGCGAQEEKFEERLYTADAACTALSTSSAMKAEAGDTI